MLFLTVCNSGCALPLKGENETMHYLIIGIGLVSIPKQEADTGILAAKTQTLGVQISDQPGLKFAAGYSNSSVVVVPETVQNALVEVSQRPFGPLIIDVNPKYTGGRCDTLSEGEK